MFLRSLLATIATFIAVWLACWLGFGWLGDWLGDWLASASLWGWVKDVLTFLLDAGALLSVLIASFFLFPAILTLTMSFFLEEIATAVEKRHYPDQAPARAQPLRESLVGALTFGIVTLLANVILLPFYFIPLVNIPIFYAVNGYLLGREYFELVGVRRLELPETKGLRRRFRFRVLLAGVVVALLLTIPLVNLVTPIVATAFMLHIFERLRLRDAKS